MASQIGVGAPPGIDPSIDPMLASIERDATLWADVWKKLRRDKRFILAAILIVIFALMGVVPRIFTSMNPNDCNILRSALKPTS